MATLIDVSVVHRWRLRCVRVGGERLVLQDRPLLGSITVAKLIESGGVQATPALDPKSATTDVWLTLRSRG